MPLLLDFQQGFGVENLKARLPQGPVASADSDKLANYHRSHKNYHYSGFIFLAQLQ